mmetsp:Transcript_3890/g.5094  ORF Transcript_3890/g.5094 Transcript_3890/m.5094 type:complete len:303 (+) Transcript_3890:26-934(+)
MINLFVLLQVIILLWSARCTAFVFFQQVGKSAELRKLKSQKLDLDEIAQNLKLEVYDLDEGIYGLSSKKKDYGIEVVRTEISTKPSLGLELIEMARGQDGQGLVLISDVSGNAAKDGRLCAGDTIVGIRSASGSRRLTALDYDLTVEGIAEVAQDNDEITIEVNRLVKRAEISVQYQSGTDSQQIKALAGENLRSLLIRSGAKVYDKKTRRFDQPYATGDCQGEGICGTCLVKVNEGAASLSPKDPTESLITKGRPVTWRAACRCVVGADNTPATINIDLTPQSQFSDELAPPVKSVLRNDE